ncbi:ferrous iron transport protein A [Actinoplanes sp. NPDC049599]|uniref:ferrous iron transport protein A n=1 Tax=Actinoplanes sp. NPDC049599 TaxID=3363903 RepID=UPI00379811C7
MTRSRPVARRVDGRTRSLAALAPGASATVAYVSASAPATATRLADLGFTPGAVVQVLRRAPLRDPVIYRVKDYELCLRREQAACVHVVEVHR